MIKYILIGLLGIAIMIISTEVISDIRTQGWTLSFGAFLLFIAMVKIILEIVFKNNE